MSLKRTPWHETLRTALSIALSALLLLALTTRVSARTPVQNWADSIDEMVAAGGYVEGQAVVALVGSEVDALRACRRPCRRGDSFGRGARDRGARDGGTRD